MNSYEVTSEGNVTTYETASARVRVTHVPDWENKPKVHGEYVIHEYDKRYVMDYWFYAGTERAAHTRAVMLVS